MTVSNQELLWPTNASSEYITARRALMIEETALLDHVERVAAQRRALPPGAELGDQTFSEAVADATGTWMDSRAVTLYDLVLTDRPLIVYHLMFGPGEGEGCSMCSSWVDAYNGVATHVRQHAEIVVIAKAPIAELSDWANRRDWHNLRIISSFGTDFNLITNAENENGSQNPGTSVFVRDGGTIRHVYTRHASAPGNEDERGMDLLNSLWNLLDLLPAGRGDWYAGNDYALAEVAARR